MQPRRVLILGSTGSIGQSALAVAAAHPDRVQIVGLAANRSWQALAEQTNLWRPAAVALTDERSAGELRRALTVEPHVFTGSDALTQLVRATDADFVLAAIVGAAGLPATLAAVERGLSVGLANKESLVVAGPLLMKRAAERGATLIPVDSEHSAIFQALRGGRTEELRRIYLTASGGPFRTWSPDRMARATWEEAQNHPTWSMGPKITIDSATMMNKALEIIEARHLFGVSPEQISVLVHPESIVHSMVEYCDGAILAQLGAPDMSLPIQYALTYPQRVPGIAPALTWDQVRTLHFEPPDFDRFPALRLGYEAARRGGTAGAALNAANEAAVALFECGRISFGRIAELCAAVLERHAFSASPTLEELFACDARTREEVCACV